MRPAWPARLAMADIKPQVYKDPRPAEYFTPFHERARTHDPDWVYDVVRIILTPPSLLFYRTRAIGAENVPRSGPGDPGAEPLQPVGPLLRRPSTCGGRSASWPSRSCSRTRCSTSSSGTVGVFPVRRGHHDEEAFKTAYAILERGGCLLMYAEGGRSRTGGLGEPRPGVGRIALESGVPVVPVAIHGSLGVRRWRKLRFPKVTVQFGEPMTLRGRALAEPRAPARGRDPDLRPGAGDVRGARREGRRGVTKALREGIESRTEQQVPAGQAR